MEEDSRSSEAIQMKVGEGGAAEKTTLRAEAASVLLFSLDPVMAGFMCQHDWAADAQIFGYTNICFHFLFSLEHIQARCWTGLIL